jgi:hypothetical protein
MLLLGCAGESSSVKQFFGISSAEPTPETGAESATPTPTPTPAASESQSRAHKKSGHDVHIAVAVEKASQASESAAEASAKAMQASKQARQAADAASHAEAPGAVVSLEQSPVPASASTPGAVVTTSEVGASTPAAKNTPDLESVAAATASHPSVATTGEPNPANAAKLIDDLDKLEKRVDRNNLSADESQRDILAQRLIQSAKKALADRDNVAAIGLAAKASTLLAPLPKIPVSLNSSTR